MPTRHFARFSAEAVDERLKPRLNLVLSIDPKNFRSTFTSSISVPYSGNGCTPEMRLNTLSPSVVTRFGNSFMTLRRSLTSSSIASLDSTMPFSQENPLM